MVFEMKFVVLFFLISMATVLANILDEIWLETANSGSVDAEDVQNVYDYYTSLATYGIFPSNNQELEFRVKGCSDVFVLLSAAANLQSPSFYELVLGANSNRISFIRRLWNTRVSFITLTPGIVSCNEFRRFKYKWTADGHLTVNKINYTVTERVIDCMDISPLPVAGAGIMSAYGSNAVWAIKHTGRYMGYFCGVDNAKGNMKLLKVYSQTSSMECAMLCHVEGRCLGFNVYKKTKKCQLIAARQVVTKVTAAGWGFYTKCLNNKTVCLACIV